MYQEYFFGCKLDKTTSNIRIKIYEGKISASVNGSEAIIVVLATLGFVAECVIYLLVTRAWFTWLPYW